MAGSDAARDDGNNGGAMMQGDDLAKQIPYIMGMLPIIAVLGALGNLLVLYVYCCKRSLPSKARGIVSHHQQQQQQQQITANLFIQVLALNDSLTCLLMIPLTTYVEINAWSAPFRSFCNLYYFLNNTSIPFTALLITAIAVDRYFCICHPFLKLMTVRRAKIGILMLLVPSMAVGVISSFHLNASERVVQAKDNSTYVRYECVETGKDNNSEVQKISASRSNNSLSEGFNFVDFGSTFELCLLFTCMFIMCILYTLIFSSVIKVRQRRERLKGGRTKNTLRSRNTAPAAENCVLHKLESLPLNEKSATNLSVSMSNSQVALNAASSNGDPPLRRAVTVVDNGPRTSNSSSTWRFSTSLSIQNRINVGGIRDTVSFQNLKTAGMLSVVTAVYVTTMFPSSLMAAECMKLYLPIFYLYYVNSAANPLIYGFMNYNFRNDLKKIFCHSVSNKRHRRVVGATEMTLTSSSAENGKRATPRYDLV